MNLLQRLVSIRLTDQLGLMLDLPDPSLQAYTSFVVHTDQIGLGALEADAHIASAGPYSMLHTLGLS